VSLRREIPRPILSISLQGSEYKSSPLSIIRALACNVSQFKWLEVILSFYNFVYMGKIHPS